MVRTRRQTREKQRRKGLEEAGPYRITHHHHDLSSMLQQASPIASSSTLSPASSARKPSAIVVALRTSPRSMSPSSIFDGGVVDIDDKADDDDDDAFNSYNDDIHGWLSETSRHLHSGEIPSSASPVKGKGKMKLLDSPLGASPTLSTKTLQRKAQIRANTLPQVSRTWLSTVQAGAAADRSPADARRTSVPLLRPATPTSSIKSRSSRVFARPQSAMKHRSANEYSSGKNVPTIVVSSGKLNRHLAQAHNYERLADEDDEDAAVLGALPVLSSTPSLFQRSTTFPPRTLKRSLTHSTLESDDCSTSSPLREALAAGKAARFRLYSRAALPATSFYHRTKEEEGSPTPVRRRL